MTTLKLPPAGWRGEDRRGAALGRPSLPYPEADGQPSPGSRPAGRLRLARVRLDAGGYDNGGAYWGHGAPLWLAHGQTEAGHRFERWLRAADRAEAKAIIREKLEAAHPGIDVRFWR